MNFNHFIHSYETGNSSLIREGTDSIISDLLLPDMPNEFFFLPFFIKLSKACSLHIFFHFITDLSFHHIFPSPRQFILKVLKEKN